MAFLAAFAAKMAQWLLSKGAAIIIRIVKYMVESNKSHKKTAEIIKKVEDAKSKEDLDKAADDIANNY